MSPSLVPDVPNPDKENQLAALKILLETPNKLIGHFAGATAYPLFILGVILFVAGLWPQILRLGTLNPVAIIAVWVSANLMMILGTTVRIVEYVYKLKAISEPSKM